MAGSLAQAATVSGRPELSRAAWGDRRSPPPGSGAAAWDAATRVLYPASRPITEARGFATETLRDWDLAELCDEVELVVRELVTNALHEGFGPAVVDDAAPEGLAGVAESQPAADQRRQPSIQLKLVRKGGHVLCLVADPGDEAPAFQEPPGGPEFLDNANQDPPRPNGCYRRWGWARLRDGGKVVWALFHAPE